MGTARYSCRTTISRSIESSFIVVDEAYETDYEGTIVLDIGAHKGYYAAYAVQHGARRVVAYEPESANLEALERTAAAYRDDAAWTSVTQQSTRRRPS